MPGNLLIVGSGSQARYVVDIVSQTRNVQIIGIADIENPSNVGKVVNGIPILCTAEEIIRQYHSRDCHVIIAYGKNRRKEEISEMLSQAGFQFLSIVSPLAYISPSAHLGEGCIINPHSTVMPNARIGRHAIIHSQSVIEHDNLIGDFTNMSPGVSLSGNVEVGKGTYIYTGASVIPNIKIGKWCTVAAGAVVTCDVPDEDVVAGVPARSILKRPN